MFQHLRHRRALITGAAALGAGLAAAGPGRTQAQAAGWRPKLDAQDDWMELPGEHRFVFDSITPAGAAAALEFGHNYYTFNQSGYGLGPSSLAVVIILRSRATPFGYNDAVWAKYGEHLGDMLKLVDPATKAAPRRNLYNVKDLEGVATGGTTLAEMTERGTRFAVCGAATQGISANLAKATGAKTEDVHADLVAGLIPNAHLVPAGIVALNRTQERGYAVAHAG